MRARFGFLLIGGWRLSATAILGALIAAGCVAPAGTHPGDTSRSNPTVSGHKTLRIAALREPVQGLAPPGGTQHGDRQSISYVFHSGLTMYDATGSLQPFVAQTVPTLENGDWVVLPDGRMELTWRLRPDVRWHDGVPVTADDFAFGVQIIQNPEVPLFRGLGIRGLSEVIALDDRTFVAKWSEPNFEANLSGPLDLGAYPRRLLGTLYEAGDMQTFMNSPYWTTEFVGLGPFKLSQWALGSYTEAVAFDEFFLGRPRIDRVVIRYISDLNTMVANMLAGEIDVIPNIIKIEEVMALRSVWDTRGGGTAQLNFSHIEALRFQFRYPQAPWARDARVRKALVHMTDRQALADGLLHGQTTVADAYASTQDPAYQLLERRGFPRYPFDMTAGERLLADAGWAAVSDGFVNASGERFTIEYRLVANSAYNVNMGLAITDGWKAARLNPTQLIITNELPTRQREEMKATANGVFWQPDALHSRILDVFTTVQSSTEQSLWRGNNYGAYANPIYDQMYERYVSTLQTTRRQELQVDLLKYLADDVPFIPTLYGPNNSMAYRAGVRGPTPLRTEQLVSTWNIHAWELD